MTPATTMPTTIAVRNGVATRLISGIASSFSLPGCFIGIAPKCGAGLGGEFRAAAFDEVAGFGDDVLQDFENLTYTGFPVNEFRKGFEKRRVSLDGSEGA